MALVKCRECGKEISADESSCPNCGYKNKKNNSKLIIIILSIVIVVLLFGILILCIKDESNYDKHDDRYNSNLDDNVDNNLDNNTNNNYISSSDALNIALEDLNISRNDIYDLSSELEYKFNKMVYDIDFNCNRFEYEYYIDATTGEIIKSFKERD